jgi:hypothetical protein
VFFPDERDEQSAEQSAEHKEREHRTLRCSLIHSGFNSQPDSEISKSDHAKNQGRSDNERTSTPEFCHV